MSIHPKCRTSSGRFCGESACPDRVRCWSRGWIGQAHSAVDAAIVPNLRPLGKRFFSAAPWTHPRHAKRRCLHSFICRIAPDSAAKPSQRVFFLRALPGNPLPKERIGETIGSPAEEENPVGGQASDDNLGENRVRNATIPLCGTGRTGTCKAPLEQKDDETTR